MIPGAPYREKGSIIIGLGQVGSLVNTGAGVNPPVQQGRGVVRCAWLAEKYGRGGSQTRPYDGLDDKEPRRSVAAGWYRNQSRRAGIKTPPVWVGPADASVSALLGSGSTVAAGGAVAADNLIRRRRRAVVVLHGLALGFKRPLTLQPAILLQQRDGRDRIAGGEVHKLHALRVAPRSEERRVGNARRSR